MNKKFVNLFNFFFFCCKENEESEKLLFFFFVKLDNKSKGF